MNRRRFLSASLMGASALGWSINAASPKAMFGSQLYGWGQYYQREGKDFNAHVNEVYSALRDMGYDYAEGSLDTHTPENNLREAERMQIKGLKPVSLYSGGSLHESGKATETVEKIVTASAVCAKAGFKIINCNPDALGRNKTDAELETQAKALELLGDGLRKLGLQLGIHHHTPEMANGAKEFHTNFRKTTPANVRFCYDVHWVFRGGVKPEDALKDYGPRIVSWHLRQSRSGIWWEDMDTGDINYAAIARHASEHGLAAKYTVELALEGGTKITRNAVENHRRSLDFVRKTFS